jgi:hypothetical protein
LKGSLRGSDIRQSHQGAIDWTSTANSIESIPEQTSDSNSTKSNLRRLQVIKQDISTSEVMFINSYFDLGDLGYNGICNTYKISQSACQRCGWI